MVKWFVEEFIDQEVGLAVKTNFKGNSITDFTQVDNHLKTENLLNRQYM